MRLMPKELCSILDYLTSYNEIDEQVIDEIQQLYEYVYNRLSLSDDKLLRQSLLVAQLIAQWGFSQSVVIAAMLHVIPLRDIPANWNLDSVDESISSILRGYEEIKKQLICSANEDTNNVEVANEDPLHDVYPESLYIIIAEKVTTLIKADEENSEEATKLAKEVREILIPQLKKIHAINMVDILEEICFKIENENLYNRISDELRIINSANKDSQNRFITELRRLFDRDSNIVRPKLRVYSKFIKSFKEDKRSIVSLTRYITKKSNDLKYDIDILRNKQITAYVDLTLVLDDSVNEENPYMSNDVFLHYYEVMLRRENVFLKGYYSTTDGSSHYFLIMDQMKNLYRFFVKTETEYLHYFYGDIIDKEKFCLDVSSVGDDEKIKVYKRDGRFEFVNKGTTALDFAFMIHEDIGLHCLGVKLNFNEKILPPYTILSNGDTVEIEKGPKVVAEVNWFRYIKSERAKKYLIKYFNVKYRYFNHDGQIRVWTKDGTDAFISKGATVLDLAFMLHEELGLYFDYAIINNQKDKVSVNYLLNDGDVVIIQKAKTIQANLYWFRYVTTTKAKNDLISYFNHIIAQNKSMKK